MGLTHDVSNRGDRESRPATLAANLPDPRQPTIVLFLAGLGALTATAVGRIRRLQREQTRELAEN
jgi:hypothetical protein